VGDVEIILREIAQRFGWIVDLAISARCDHLPRVPLEKGLELPIFITGTPGLDSVLSVVGRPELFPNHLLEGHLGNGKQD
jgi:hypothetical protein